MSRDLIETSTRFAVTAVMQLICFLLTSKFLSIADFGVFSLILAYSFFLSNIVALGLPAAQVYFFTDSAYKYYMYKLSAVHIVFVIICSVIIAGIAATFGMSNVVYISALTAVQSIFLVTNGFLQACNEIRKLNIVNLMLWFFLAILLFLFSFVKPTLNSMIFAYFLSTSLAIIVTVGMLYKKIFTFFNRYNNKLPQSKVKYFKIYKYGIVCFSSSIIGFLNHRLSLFFVGYISGNEAAGLFAFSIQIAERLSIFSQAFTTVFFPKIKRLLTFESQLAEVYRAASQLLFILIPASVFFVFTYPYLIHFLFGDKYDKSFDLILILIIGIFITSIARLFFMLISACGEIMTNLKISIIGLLMNLFFCAILIRFHGNVGAALASVLTSTMLLLMSFQFIRKAKL